MNDRWIDRKEHCMYALWAWLSSTIDRRVDDRERGDVPGWVMVTVMTAILVVAILSAFENPIKDAITNALDSVTGAK
jgi:hypothetical protein